MLCKESPKNRTKAFKVLYEGVSPPKMFEAMQTFSREFIPGTDIPEVVKMQLEPFFACIKPGMKIAVTCGSRGIANIYLITKSIVDVLKAWGAEPFIVPSMGSHGGSSSQGQKDVLAGYGITEDSLGCPIVSSMETVYLGDTIDGIGTYIDKNAYEADGIIVCGRIKLHTSFRYKYESGLMKMISVGLGKQKGAETVHRKGLENIPFRFESSAKHILKNTNIICGLGIIENAYNETSMIVGVKGDEIPEKEPDLLIEAKKRSGRIYFDKLDVLIVGQMGKNFSGDGMDCNVIGRFPSPVIKGDIDIQHVVALDLSEESQGNANGIGWADVTTQRLFSKLDPEATYANSITSTCLNAVRIPMIALSDLEALQIALKTCVDIDFDNPRIVYIENTLDLERIYISEALAAEANGSENIRILDGHGKDIFNQEGEIEIK